MLSDKILKEMSKIDGELVSLNTKALKMKQLSSEVFRCEGGLAHQNRLGKKTNKDVVAEYERTLRECEAAFKSLVGVKASKSGGGAKSGRSSSSQVDVAE